MKSLNHHLEVTQAQTRILLALWDLGGKKQEVKRTEVVERAKRSSEKSGDYKGILQELEKAEVIKIGKKNKAETVFLTNKGLHMLDEGLKNSGFKYESNIGAKTANALLKWIREMDGKAAKAENNAIASYDDFKSEALMLFDKLDKGYSYSGLVPIWHLRDEMGQRVERDQFTNWMMEMQAEKLLYLQSGEARGATEEQKQASINSEIRGLLFYASQPS
jgi:predicted transcriptional regulator